MACGWYVNGVRIGMGWRAEWCAHPLADHKPAGIFYGGSELEPSHKLLWGFLHSHFGDVVGTVTWVDVHTGLGASGNDVLLVEAAGKMAEVQKYFTGAHSI